jgi:glycosyltransferase involved in cell wall biosynthesis
MRVIQVPRRFVRSHWGGTETVILETCKCLLALGHHTEIFCPRALSDRNEEVIDGVAVKRFPYLYPYFGLSPAAREQMDLKGGNLFSFSLMRQLRRYPGLNVIHLHTGKRLGGIGRHIAAMRKIPYVISLHGGVYDVPSGESATWTEPTRGAFEWGKGLGWWVGARRVLDEAAAIICVGRKELEEAQRRHPNRKVVHLPNGVNAQRFAAGDGKDFRERHRIPSSAFVILVMGRIDPQKNQRLAVRLLAELARGPANPHLLLIGPVTNPDYAAKVNADIEAMDLKDRVTLIPGIETHDPDLVNAYHAADVFLLPSIHEPFGIVILEAWAAGLPVIASNVGGVPSFVADGEDGLLFPSGDLPALTRLTQDVIANRDLRCRLAGSGRNKAVDQFGWEGITKRLVDIYEEAIRENSLRQ